MPGLSTQLHEEQQAVDRAYARLDALRSQTRTRLDTVRAAGSHGSPTQRTERDSFATMYEDRLTQLRAMEDRLVFGRLDDVKGERRYIGRIGLSSENHEPILTDWRAEAARPFYEATPSNHGDIVMRRARECGAEIVPVDSEHSAIFQCLTGREGELHKILLTGSGGPFRGWTREQTRDVTPEMAVRHPNWSMGAKISVDSATMMNKGLEFIEAMHLFGVTPDDIQVLIHPESVVHSMVELLDGTVIAQLLSLIHI